MESFLTRYRNLTVLLVVVTSQLLLLAWQVKTAQDVPLIRVWAVTTVVPVARILDDTRRYTFGSLQDYFVLVGVRDDNRRLRQEVTDLRMKNHFLAAQVSTADRARALLAFQAETSSKTLPARVIGSGTGVNSANVFIDRGASSGVEKGMAVVTPEGIVGKIAEAYPTASLVLLVTDPSFAAGVVSRKNVYGTLKGQGHGTCIVDYVQNEQNVEPGEWFYTSGYDRVFPRGFPAGQVSAVHNGRAEKEIFVNPIGLQGGLDQVLVVLQGVHQPIPENEVPSQTIHMMAPPPEAARNAEPQRSVLGNTTADRLRTAYQEVGAAQGHKFGEGGPGTPPPNFNMKQVNGAKPEASKPRPEPETPGDTEDTVPANVTPPEQPAATPTAAPANPAPPASPNPRPAGRGRR